MSNINEGQRNSFLVESSCPNKTTQNTEEKKSQLFPPQKKKNSSMLFVEWLEYKLKQTKKVNINKNVYGK